MIIKLHETAWVKRLDEVGNPLVETSNQLEAQKNRIAEVVAEHNKNCEALEKIVAGLWRKDEIEKAKGGAHE